MWLQDDVQATFSMVLLGCYKSLVEQHCFAAFVTHTHTHTAHTSSSLPFFLSAVTPRFTLHSFNDSISEKLRRRRKEAADALDCPCDMGLDIPSLPSVINIIISAAVFIMFLKN